MEGLKKIRIQKGITQTEFAEALGVSTKTVYNYENDRRGPNIAMLIKMAELLGCKVDDLL